MSLADQIFIENVKDILTNGVSDADMQVRPRWDDGAPAHTIK
ncbi:MAG TPA: thymidylate synthase, partial [Clostridiales bacterium]|nr:thymidylate synthase [Clostridiales bacterium]